MSTMRAVVRQDDKSVKVEQKPKPSPKANEILIKTTYIGQNPTDYKHADFISKTGYIMGCDAVGIVEELGQNVPSEVAKGQHRGFFTRGGKSATHGAAAEYVAVPYDLSFLVPDGTSDAEAASLPIPFFTAVQGLFAPERLELTEPQAGSSLPATQRDEWVLVWSGASAVGQYAVQLATLAGYKVVTTASKDNFELLKSYGAQATFDYKDSDVVDKIKEATGSSLALAMDCVSNEQSMASIQQSMSSSGGKFVCILPPDESKLPRKDVKAIPTLLYTALDGKTASFATWDCPAGPNAREHHVKWLKYVTELLRNNYIKIMPIEERGGLEDINQGFKDMADGKIRAKKLVYKV